MSTNASQPAAISSSPNPWRVARYAVAHAYASHTDGGEGGATSTYVRASLTEVAASLAALTGEPHPLATTERW